MCFFSFLGLVSDNAQVNSENYLSINSTFNYANKLPTWLVGETQLGSFRYPAFPQKSPRCSVSWHICVFDTLPAFMKEIVMKKIKLASLTLFIFIVSFVISTGAFAQVGDGPQDDYGLPTPEIDMPSDENGSDSGPENQALPEIISLDFFDQEGEPVWHFPEGSLVPFTGVVMFAEDVPSIDVEFWADIDFDGLRDADEMLSLRATKILDSAQDWAYFYEFSETLQLKDDGPSPGNFIRWDRMLITAKPTDGEEYQSSIIVENVAPTWVLSPTLDMQFDEDGVATKVSVKGVFSDIGDWDAHKVEVLVDGEKQVSKILAPGVTDFEVELDGPLEPASGSRITVDLFDDDLGEAHFYITLAGVISKSYIKNLARAGGTGSVKAHPAFGIPGRTAVEAAAANSRLDLFAAGTVAKFRENPDWFTKNDCRLYSRSLYAVGFDGTQLKYFDFLKDGSFNIGGHELWSFHGSIQERDRYKTTDFEAATGKAGVFIFGAPDNGLEPGFQLVMRRTSKNIWADFGVQFFMAGNFAEFTLVKEESSAFPSNRIWIDGERKRNYLQSCLVKLWQSSPRLGKPFVVSHEETGIFEKQPYCVPLFPPNSLWWPIEN